MHTFFSDLILQKIDCSEVHSPKALLPIVVTELGIMMDFKEVHSRKAKFPIGCNLLWREKHGPMWWMGPCRLEVH